MTGANALAVCLIRFFIAPISPKTRSCSRRFRGASHPTIDLAAKQQSRLVLSEANRRGRPPDTRDRGTRGRDARDQLLEERVAFALKRIEQNYAPT